MRKILSLFAILFSLNIYGQTNQLSFLNIEIDSETKIINTEFEFNPKSLNNPNLVFHQTLGKSFWKISNINCQWRNISTSESSVDQVIIRAESFCPETKGDLSLNLAFLKNVDPNFRVLARVIVDGYESTYLLNKWEKELKINQKKASFIQYINMGTEHMGVSPEQWISVSRLKFPPAFEHILFAIALIVTSGTFIHTFKAISGFAIGCLLTISFCAFGVVAVPTTLVQPAIALSIIYVAGSSFLFKKSIRSFWAASLFGVVHGFGFATALLGLKLTFARTAEAVLGFNLGLYIGLITIILLITPILLLLKKYSNIHSQFIRSSSFGVLLVGSYWFVERTFF